MIIKEQQRVEKEEYDQRLRILLHKKGKSINDVPSDVKKVIRDKGDIPKVKDIRYSSHPKFTYHLKLDQKIEKDVEFENFSMQYIK